MKIKITVWKAGALNLMLWITGIAIWLHIIIWLFEIGGNNIDYFFYANILVFVSSIISVIYCAFGTIEIKKNATNLNFKLQFKGGKRYNLEVIKEKLWWNYHATMHTGNGESSGVNGPNMQIAIWISFKTKDGRKIKIRQIFPNWTSTPNDFNYNVERYNGCFIGLSCIGIKRLNKLIENL